MCWWLGLSHGLYLDIQSGLLWGLHSTLPSGALPRDIWSPLPLQPVTLRLHSELPLKHRRWGWVSRKNACLATGFPSLRGQTPGLPFSDVCKRFFIYPISGYIKQTQPLKQKPLSKLRRPGMIAHTCNRCNFGG